MSSPTLPSDWRLRLSAGYVGHVDLLARAVAESGADPAEGWFARGEAAAAAGLWDLAVRRFDRAVALAPAIRRYRDAHQKAIRAASTAVRPGEGKLLLLREWGHGLCSELEMALCGIVLAELSGRRLLVHWGEDAVYRKADTLNAWTGLFEGLEDVAPLVETGRSFFPPYWVPSNWSVPPARVRPSGWPYQHALDLVGRSEDVVVLDFHNRIAELDDWLPPDHPWAGGGPLGVSRAAMAHGLRPVAEVVAEAERFHARHLAGRSVVAAHVRGLEKQKEQGDLRAVNDLIAEDLGRRLDADPDALAFVMSDSPSELERVAARHPGRVVWTESERGEDGIHLHAADRVRQGREMLVDLLVAAKCDAFIGNGRSNVANLVSYAKDWPDGTCRLVRANQSFERVPHWYGPP